MKKTTDGIYQPPPGDAMTPSDSGWEFRVAGTGFEATLGVELDSVPLEGPCVPLTAASAGAVDSAMPKPSSESAKPGA